MKAREVIFYAALAVAVILGTYVLFLIRDILILIFVAILFATAIAPVVNLLRSRIGQGQAVLIIYLVLAIIIATVGYVAFLVLIEQTTTLATNLPALIGTLTAYVNSIDIPYFRDLLVQLLDEVSAAVSPQEAGVTNGVAKGIFSVTVSVFTMMFGFVSVLVIAYYWIAERAAIIRLFVSFFSPDKRPIARAVWQQVEDKLGGWVRGQLLLMGIIGALSAIGYSIMGLRYALFLAVIAGITELIPILGPWIGTAPAVLVALSQSFWLAVAVVVFAVIIQNLEGNILVPRIIGKVVGISPLVVIIAILIGLTLMGIPGALLAVPVASTLQVIVQALVLEPQSLTRGTTEPTP